LRTASDLEHEGEHEHAAAGDQPAMMAPNGPVAAPNRAGSEKMPLDHGADHHGGQGERENFCTSAIWRLLVGVVGRAPPVAPASLPR